MPAQGQYACSKFQFPKPGEPLSLLHYLMQSPLFRQQLVPVPTACLLCWGRTNRLPIMLRSNQNWERNMSDGFSPWICRWLGIRSEGTQSEKWHGIRTNPQGESFSKRTAAESVRSPQRGPGGTALAQLPSGRSESTNGARIHSSPRQGSTEQ